MTVAGTARARTLVPAVLVAAVAAALLFRTPFSASNLDVSPDSSEYALAAHALALDGRYAITVEGRDLPPRYPPWFSAIALAPAYLILGPEVGNAIVPILLFAIAGVAFAFLLGVRIGGIPSGALAALAVLALPEYRFWSRQIVTDAPTVALAIVLAWLFVVLTGRGEARLRLVVAAGILVGFASALRPLNAVMAVPFAIHALRFGAWTTRFRRLAVVLAPSVLVALANAIYNARSFGSPLRTGYHFWCPVPYDYVGLVFSTRYAASNLSALGFMAKWVAAAGAVVAVAIAAWPRARSAVAARPAARRLLEFVVLGLLPIAIVHVVYFFPGDRFFLPLVATTAVLVAGLVGLGLERAPAGAITAILIAALAGGATWRARHPDPSPPKRLAAERIARLTPSDAWIVSAIEPSYLERLAARGSTRRVVPASRSVEYASKLIARRRIPDPVPAPRDWFDHRCEGLARGGAEEAVAVVASESPEALAGALASGHRVFVDTTLMSQADEPLLGRLETAFRVTRREDSLYELERKTDSAGTLADSP